MGRECIVQGGTGKLLHHFNYNNYITQLTHTHNNNVITFQHHTVPIFFTQSIIFLFLMQNDLEKHSSTNQFQQEPEDKKKYVKLTSQVKELFIQKIVFQNLSIKQASQLLRINYSSAKAIASTHKKIKAAKMKKSACKRATKVCQYRCLDQKEEATAVTQVCSSIGGLLTSEIAMPKRKFITKGHSSICDISSRKENVPIMQGC